MLKKETLFETNSSRPALGTYTKGFSFLAEQQSSFHLPMFLPLTAKSFSDGPTSASENLAALVMKHDSHGRCRHQKHSHTGSVLRDKIHLRDKSQKTENYFLLFHALFSFSEGLLSFLLQFLHKCIQFCSSIKCVSPYLCTLLQRCLSKAYSITFQPVTEI